LGPHGAEVAAQPAAGKSLAAVFEAQAGTVGKKSKSWVPQRGTKIKPKSLRSLGIVDFSPFRAGISLTLWEKIILGVQKKWGGSHGGRKLAEESLVGKAGAREIVSENKARLPSRNKGCIVEKTKKT